MTNRDAYNSGAYHKRTDRGMDYCEGKTLRERVWWIMGYQDAKKEPDA